jgi:hypothetical protein
VPVHGHTLFVANEEQPLVPLRPICDALRIDFRTQYRKLVGHPTFAPTVVMMTTVGADGKLREMTAMPADLVMGWLMTIHPDKVAPKLRETLIDVQRTAARLLHAAWAAMRAGLPLPAGPRPEPGFFDRAPPQHWLRHPSVEAAVMLNREAEAKRAAAAQAARGLRAAALRRVKEAGLRAAELDLLTRLAFFPAPPAQPALPLDA